MALDFPDNPSPGDTFDSGSVLWRWTGTTWEIVGAATGATRLRYSAVGISSSVSLPNTTNTTIPYGERLGGEDWRNGNGTQLTVPADGVYLVTSYIELGIGISTLTRIRNTIICAGSASQQFLADSVPGAVSHTAGFSKSVAVPLKAGDTISVIAWHNNGSGNSLTARTNLSAVLLDSDLAIPVSGGGAPISPRSDVNSAGDLSTTGEADLGVSVTWTAVAGRRYMVTCEANISSSVATDSTYIVLTDQANSAKVARYSYTGGANRQAGVTVNEVITATSDGSLTRKGRFGRIAGTGTVTAYNRANAPAVLIVIDLGH